MKKKVNDNVKNNVNRHITTNNKNKKKTNNKYTSTKKKKRNNSMASHTQAHSHAVARGGASHRSTGFGEPLLCRSPCKRSLAFSMRLQRLAARPQWYGITDDLMYTLQHEAVCDFVLRDQRPCARARRRKGWPPCIAWARLASARFQHHFQLERQKPPAPLSLLQASCATSCGATSHAASLPRKPHEVCRRQDVARDPRGVSPGRGRGARSWRFFAPPGRCTRRRGRIGCSSPHAETFHASICGTGHDRSSVFASARNAGPPIVGGRGARGEVGHGSTIALVNLVTGWRRPKQVGLSAELRRGAKKHGVAA